MAEAAGLPPLSAGLADFGLGLGSESETALPTCLVLGNFDGVHLGHQAILAAARESASRLGVALTAITFEPHPRTVLDPGLDFRLLSTFDLRRRLLVAHGVDHLWVLPFNERIRQMTPPQFMKRLEERLQIQAMVVGPSFSIGKGAEGRLDFLTGYAAEAGFVVQVVDPINWQGEAISSSAIRDQLLRGDLAAVGEMPTSSSPPVRPSPPMGFTSWNWAPTRVPPWGRLEASACGRTFRVSGGSLRSTVWRTPATSTASLSWRAC